MTSGGTFCKKQQGSYMSRALGTSAATSSFSACSKSWRSFAEREMASKEFFADPRNDPRRSCWCVWCLCCCSDHHIESYLMTNFWVQSTFAMLSIFEFLVLIFTECTKSLGGALIGCISINQISRMFLLSANNNPSPLGLS